MGFFKWAGAGLALIVAIGVGVLKGPVSWMSLELLDLLDRQLDKVQGGLEYNLASRYFNGIFAPTTEEIPGGPGLALQVVEGGIPSELAGVFLRIGPNPWATPSKRHQVFDGDGMLHTVRIKQGEATYHNAYVQTPRLKFEQARGSAYFTRIGELHGLVGLLKAILVMARKGPLSGLHKLELGTANTAVVLIPDGRLWALHEASLPFEMRLTEAGGIVSVGYEKAGGRLDYAMSAHPKIDARTGEIVFHGYASDGGQDGQTFMKFGRFDQAGIMQSLFKVNATGASFAHDMVLSEHFGVLIDSSVRFSPERLVEGGSVFAFDDKHRTNLAVIPRNATSTAEAIWFQSPTNFAWVHPLHAWEEEDGNALVIWAPLGFASQRTGGVLDGCCDVWHMTELRLDLSTTQVTMNVIDSGGRHHGEFSRIREDLTATGFVRFGYTGLANVSGQDFDFIGVTKWDMKEKKVSKELMYPTGWIGGDPIFMPNPEATGDPSDDGFLCMFLFGPHEDSSDFVIYNARTFSEKPVARLRVPRRVPFGFHGSWLEEIKFQEHLARSS